MIEHDELPSVPGEPDACSPRCCRTWSATRSSTAARTGPAAIRVSAEQQGDDWLLTVDDNGIGIDPQYADRIFTIFQRLHLRDQYGGTGIGLALCRRIVDFHRGRIWLAEEARPGC